MTFSTHNLEVTNTLRDISPTSWNSLTGADSFYLSHEWLLFVEEEGTADVSYLLARNGDDLLGALPIYAVRTEPNKNYQLNEFLDGTTANRRWLVLGTRRAYVNDFLTGHGLDKAQREELITTLVATAEHRAHELGLDGVAFLYLTTSAAQVLHRLRPEMQPLLLSMDARIFLPGSQFDDYVSGLGSQRGYAVRKDLRRFETADYTVGIERLSDCWREAGPLVANVQQKYGHNDTAETCQRGLSAQAENLNPRTVVFTLRTNGVLQGCALFYTWRKTLYGRVVGFNYKNLSNACEYFFLYFYKPIQYAYENGYKCLHLGRGSYSAKLRRGAVPGALWAMVPSCIKTSNKWRQRNADTLCSWQQEHPFPCIEVPLEWM